MRKPFRYFKTLPEIIRFAVMTHVRFPLSLRQVEDLLREIELIQFSVSRLCCEQSIDLSVKMAQPQFLLREAWAFIYFRLKAFLEAEQDVRILF